MKSSANRAVFLDRDGVINQKFPEGQYVTRWEEFCFLPGIAEAIAVLKGAGFRVFVVTNQRCVAKGFVSLPEMDVLHHRMLSALAAADAAVDGVYCCPHDIVPPCECRKPRPGMLVAAARTHQLDLARSWMIGDSPTDIEAGKNAGCRTVRILTVGDAESGAADLFAESLPDAVRQILACGD